MTRAEKWRALVRSPVLTYGLLCRGRYDFTYDRIRFSVRRMPWVKRINLLRSGLNLLHRGLRPWSMPLHMQFELANYCNLRCPVCPAGRHEVSRAARAMDPGLFQAVLDEVGPYLLTMSLWGWGESLLHPELGRILRSASRFGAATLLSTNGQCLDREPVINAILEAPPSHLIVAIDGLTDESNSRFRVGARLEPALDGVRRLAELKRLRNLRFPVLHMRFIVMKHNEHEAADAPSFAAAHGFDMLTLRRLSIVASEDAIMAHSQLAAGDDRPGAQPNGRGADSEYICMQPFWFPSLFADGTVVACEQDFNASAPLGVVDGGVSFRDVWFGAGAARLRKVIRDEAGNLSFCRNCPACGRENSDTSFDAVMLRPGAANLVVLEN